MTMDNMKKEVLFGILIIFLIIAFSFVIAQDNDAELSVEEKGYVCLEEKVEARTCDRLNTQEKIFSLLAIGKCKDELLANSQDNGKCWPALSCDVKTTAQAILALSEAGYDTDKAETWLISQNSTSADLIWYLQIESSKPMYDCTITYSGGTAQVSFGEDKLITSITGGCFSGSVGVDYWPKISPLCYDKEFTISCNESFLTTLLYQKDPDSPIYVSKNVQSAAEDGETTEKVSSFCFKKGGVCNYEGSLWAALVLDSLIYDMAPYLPYLVAMENEYRNYFPEAFLWHLTGDPVFYNRLLTRQMSSGVNPIIYYWQVSGEGKIYDTALALYSIQYDEPEEKTKAINSLSELQEQDGCWNHGNIRDTAFILYAVWPGGGGYYPDGNGDDNGNGDECIDDNDCLTDETCVSGSCVSICINDSDCASGEICVSGGCITPSKTDCGAAGYYCMSGYSCKFEAEGNILDDYDCTGGFICCSKKLTLNTCSAQAGVICSSGQICQGGNVVAASDTATGQKCCVGGTCTTTTGDEYTCESNGGECRMYGCEDDEEVSSAYTCEWGDDCCFKKTDGAQDGEKKSYLWIWILVILIVLVVLGIIFKDTLRRSLFKLKSGVGRGRAKPGYGRRPPPGRPGYPPPAPLTGHPERMPMPRGLPPRPRRLPTRRPRGELGDVLKKLKEMGK